MPVTQKELAKYLKISQVTVSRALRGCKGVKEGVRKRVIAAARRYGYSLEVTNYEARMMRQRACGREPATNVICAMVSIKDYALPFNGPILRGLVEEAERIGVEVVVAGGRLTGLPLIVSRRQADAMVRLMGDIEFERNGSECPIPWASILFDAPGGDLVTVDNAGGARAIGQHLGTLGHRQVMYVGPDNKLSLERVQGLRAGLAEQGIELPDAHVFLRRFVASGGPTGELLEEILAEKHMRPGASPFTAIAAYNDYMAATIIRILRQKGWRIPEDMSVSGFDGVVPAEVANGDRITTAAMPLEQLGIEAIQLLSWRLRSPEAPRRRMVLDTMFVPGDTTAPPRARC